MINYEKKMLQLSQIFICMKLMDVDHKIKKHKLAVFLFTIIIIQFMLESYSEQQSNSKSLICALKCEAL